jgi:hypothetical protein
MLLATNMQQKDIATTHMSNLWKLIARDHAIIAPLNKFISQSYAMEAGVESVLGDLTLMISGLW